MTEEEKQELETLRQEKRQRTQTARAQAALEQAGVPGAFASLLAGEEDAETDRRTEQFRAAYQAALAEEVRTRLPQRPPVVTPPAPSLSRSRGVKRVR